MAPLSSTSVASFRQVVPAGTWQVELLDGKYGPALVRVVFSSFGSLEA